MGKRERPGRRPGRLGPQFPSFFGQRCVRRDADHGERGARAPVSIPHSHITTVRLLAHYGSKGEKCTAHGEQNLFNTKPP